MNSSDLSALFLTLKLAVSTVVILLLVATPLAWWLATTKSKFKILWGALFALPIVLPPTVLGFYLLVFLSPQNYLGQILAKLGFAPLVFTFGGLLVGSVLYSLPFVLQPIQNSFEAINPDFFSVAATLGANKLDQFKSIALPQAGSGIFTAAILGFAHTIGEFGVVLMIGGSIPAKPKFSRLRFTIMSRL